MVNLIFFSVLLFYNIIILIKYSKQKINIELLLFIEIGYNIAISNIFYDKKIYGA